MDSPDAETGWPNAAAKLLSEAKPLPEF